MVVKTATYSGMNLKGEIRESISLDEDDLSDVEDEVFIRDGKNGFKLAEELNVKRPLMAPRRRSGKHESGSRLKPRPSCRAWCKPCCYVFLSLSVLIGLIILVVVLVSIYPLPLDRLKDWIVSKANKPRNRDDRLPCSSLKITEIWAINLPNLTTDSPVRAIDVDNDGVEDVVFGFGTGENDHVMPDDVFCPIFMGMPPPCNGGIIALNGRNGDTIWKRWLNDTIFGVHCTADVNLDGTNDCLIVGVDGTIAVIDSRTGEDVWMLNMGKMNVFVANFIDDRNGDNISDVITSHSYLEDKTSGHIILLSGKSGREIKRVQTPNRSKTFFMPQLLKQNESSLMVLFGTGTPNSPGNLSVVPINDLESLENKSITLYEDKFKGVLTQPALADITGDGVPDIVASMYNSTVVAIDGKSWNTIWSYTFTNGVTDMSPTPAFFNLDEVPDFLVVYQKYDSIFHYNYTEASTQDSSIDRFTLYWYKNWKIGCDFSQLRHSQTKEFEEKSSELSNGAIEALLVETIGISVSRLQGTLGKLQGQVVGSILDFLNKELRRLLEERKAHAMCWVNERERNIREAAEAGRRQKEIRRRKEHDEIFKQIVKVTQESVDVYLQDIITEGMDFAGKDEALRYVLALANKVEKEVNQIDKSYAMEGVDTEDELIADLVHHFVLPEVEKQTVRESIVKQQQHKLKTVHETIYQRLEKMPKVDQKTSFNENSLYSSSPTIEHYQYKIEEMLESAANDLKPHASGSVIPLAGTIQGMMGLKSRRSSHQSHLASEDSSHPEILELYLNMLASHEELQRENDDQQPFDIQERIPEVNRSRRYQSFGKELDTIIEIDNEESASATTDATIKDTSSFTDE
ncbi:hypothetical protein HUJ04_004022 [Dendroctonus ponderosae]|nr:hypothetical protein HUJ04_004022 [Dendroctonus ponderosae]